MTGQTIAQYIMTNCNEVLSGSLLLLSCLPRESGDRCRNAFPDFLLTDEMDLSSCADFETECPVMLLLDLLKMLAAATRAYTEILTLSLHS